MMMQEGDRVGNKAPVVTSPVTRARIANTLAASQQAGSTAPRLSRWYRSKLAHYYRSLIRCDAKILEIGCGEGGLLAELPNRDVVGVDIDNAALARARARVPWGRFHEMAGEALDLGERFDVIIVSDTLNSCGDVQQVLQEALRVSHAGTRLIVNFHNTLWRPWLALGARLGLVSRQPDCSWLSAHDVRNFAYLADWQVITQQSRILCPCPLSCVERFVNRWLAPWLPALNLCIFQVARPRLPEARGGLPSVSVIVPARNEAGNLHAAVERTPVMGAWTELVFVEGHSTDATWAVTQALPGRYPERRIKVLKQSGKGKGNAVRDGFAAAEGDVLMILDADLTVPPEDLPRFFEALVSGRAEFANGVRLVYPMEKRAMRFINLCGNKFFALAFSWLLGQDVKDTLCGTKVLWRTDYERIVTKRAFFGEFDPFGDFDLLFGATKQNLHIVDVPVRYQDRTYGNTNIQRWRHGWLLLRMVVFGAAKLKFV